MLRALKVIIWRELTKFSQQSGRVASALVRPVLWLVVFAAGFQNIFGVSIIPPYETYIIYQEYIVPGLIGMIMLFNGMQSSLSMVYDREMGMMRLLLTAPVPRWFLLFAKLLGATILSIVQTYIFLLVCWAMDLELPWFGLMYALPTITLGAFMVGAMGLLVSVMVRQLENFAGTMNFVIFPMFFLSSALYPLWRFEEAGANVIFAIANWNPLTHAIELIRFSLYGQFNGLALAVVSVTTLFFFMLAVIGYDPQKGMTLLSKKG